MDADVFRMSVKPLSYGAAVASSVEIDVWVWSLDVTPAEASLLALVLSPDEQARASRFVKEQDRRRWMASRAKMRHVLGDVTGRPAKTLDFGEERHGRPLLANGPHDLSFNLAHSGSVGVLALSWDARVGVDVEVMRPLTDDEMAWPLSPQEKEALGHHQGAARLAAFFRYWTLKEAFIKAVGDGVSLPLDSFDISAMGDGPARLLRHDGAVHAIGDWAFAEMRLSEDHVAAVATLAEGRKPFVRWRKDTGLKSGRASINNRYLTD